MGKLSFSGHETFSCKIYWLKKGYDLVKAGKRFTDDDAVVALGVGKNMVTSIRFWLKAFDIVDEEDQVTSFADFIFADGGVDPYLEDTLTLWLLHYQLVKKEKASIYNMVFNQFRRERTEFTKEHLKRFLNRVILEEKATFSSATLDSDIKVFLANYVNQKSSEIEESYNSILQELALVTSFKQLDQDGHLLDWYQFDLQPKQLPIELLLFVVLDNPTYGQSISLSHLANDPSSLGNIFLLTEGSLVSLLKDIPSKYATYTETAGNQVLQLKSKLDKYKILKNYFAQSYANI
ncbi:DUF4007 family protein [Sphingobacterium bambusae]|uniref:DUF4007 family protein n=1 Tax=Sphingobacterium bambusae TaxID=662858 RepID=A0ABW6BKZ7_9SPHI|nr:DUF4007 family protein [Sphingobacterium bambusae]WPL47904.1 DUF4007 family protein [Sphingobacterium bambusae]